MKPGNSLKKYFKKRTNSIDALLHKPHESYTVEDFHRLRVEIKKVRALFSMLKSSAKKFKTKAFLKPHEKIFSQAGKVRELQLERTVLNKRDPYHFLKTYPGSLKLKELKQKKDFSTICKKSYPQLKKNYGRIIPFFDHVEKSDLEKFIRMQKKELQKLLKPAELKTSQVHDLRKALKRYSYNLKSLDIIRPARTLKNADALQDMMGQWHDCRVINRHLLKTADKNKTGALESEYIRRIAYRLFLKSQTLLRKINIGRHKKII